MLGAVEGAAGHRLEWTDRAKHSKLRLGVPAAVAVVAVSIVAVVVGGWWLLVGVRPAHGELVGSGGSEARESSQPSSVATATPTATATATEPSIAPGSSEPGSSPPGNLVVVHVAGQVNAPGIVQLRSGARVADAVTQAGGLGPDADPSAINLARLVVDGEQIYVPKTGEGIPTGAGGGGLVGGAGAGGGAGGGEGAGSGSVGAASGGASGTGTSAGSMVNINTADAKALMELPGVGEVMSGRIVAWRESHGGFASVEDLRQVSGIGPKVFERLKELVTV